MRLFSLHFRLYDILKYLLTLFGKYIMLIEQTDTNVSFRLDGTVRRFESRLDSDIQFTYIPRYERRCCVMVCTDFVIEVLGRVVSSICATYIVRLIDKIRHKNNRPRQ